MEIKTDVAGVYKDINSGGLINKDNVALNAYKKQKDVYQRFKRIEDRLANLENKIDTLLNSVKRDILDDNNCS